MKKIAFTKRQLLNLANAYADVSGTCLLLSNGTRDSAKASHLFLFPYQELWVTDGQLFQRKDGYVTVHPLSWENIKQLISGNWVFFLGYEMGFLTSDKLRSQYRPDNALDAYLVRPCCHLILPEGENQVTVNIDEEGLLCLPEYQKLAIAQLLSTCVPECDPVDGKRVPKITLNTTKEDYINNVETIQEWIRDGEVYQLTLSHELLVEHTMHPFEFFLQLTEYNPTSFSCFMNVQGEAILSCSPERLLKKEGLFVETRPIKGTRPRGRNIDEDKQLLAELENSEKERAELVMITDLMRNDLSIVCEPGSVKVPELLRTEVYKDLYHRLSIVQGRVLQGLHPIDILRAVFPGGSVTGCPKICAMEYILKLEKRRRGAYTGSVGYILENGDLDCSILIRTLYYKNGTYSLQVGGGIVIDSNPVKEWEETLHKATSILFGERI